MSHKRQFESEIDCYTKYCSMSHQGETCACDMVNPLHSIAYSLKRMRQEMEWISYGGKQKYYNKDTKFYQFKCCNCQKEFQDSEVPREFFNFHYSKCYECTKEDEE